LFLKVSHLALDKADTAKKVLHIRVALINKGQYGFDTMIIGPRRELLYQGATDTLNPVNGVYADNLDPRYAPDPPRRKPTTRFSISATIDAQCGWVASDSSILFVQ
jgi:hypothetical protein